MDDPKLPDDLEPLARAWVALPPRPAQALEWILLERRAPSEVAARYDIGESVFGVMLLRALGELRRELGEPGPSLDEGAERRDAEGLLAALHAQNPSAAPPPWGALAQRVYASGPSLAPRIRALRAEQAQSPSARRWELLRRVGLWALCALALWLYLRHR